MTEPPAQRGPGFSDRRRPEIVNHEQQRRSAKAMAVSAYFKRQKMLPFVFARQNTRLRAGDKTAGKMGVPG